MVHIIECIVDTIFDIGEIGKKSSNCFIFEGHEAYNFVENALCGGNVHIHNNAHWEFQVIELELLQIEYEDAI